MSVKTVPAAIGFVPAFASAKVGYQIIPVPETTISSIVTSAATPPLSVWVAVPVGVVAVRIVKSNVLVTQAVVEV